MGDPMKDIREENGFTIVELMAAMVISSLVVALALAMYLFGGRIMGSWEKRTNLETIVNQCQETITGDAIHSSEVYECNDSSLVLEEYPGDTVRYVFSHGVVARNNVRFSPPNLLSPASAGNRNTIRLLASVSSSVDTSTESGWPVRFWSVKVLGRMGKEADSTEADFSTIFSSQELFRMDSTASITD